MRRHLFVAKKIFKSQKRYSALKVVNLQKMAARIIPLILYYRIDQLKFNICKLPWKVVVFDLENYKNKKTGLGRSLVLSVLKLLFSNYFIIHWTIHWFFLKINVVGRFIQLLSIYSYHFWAFGQLINCITNF